MQDSVLSVIIPVYNVSADIVEKCLNSIIQQCYGNCEIIFVDDGSEAELSEAYRNLCNFDNRVIYLYQNNCGVSAARNRGLDMASGSWIAFIDSDDEVISGFFHTAVNFAEDNDLDVVIGGFIHKRKSICNHDIVITENSIQLIAATLDITHRINNDIENQLLGYSCGKIFRADLLRNIRFPEDIKIREDIVFCLNVYGTARRIGFIPDPVYHYYDYSYAATKRYRPNIVSELQAFFSLCEQYLTDHSLLDMQKLLNKAVIFSYMSIIRLGVMHKHSPLSFRKKLDIIKESFYIEPWHTAFRSTKYTELPLPYNILFLSFKTKCSCFIFILYVIDCIIKAGSKFLLRRR